MKTVYFWRAALHNESSLVNSLLSIAIAAIVAPLLVNLFTWRRDRERVQLLRAAHETLPPRAVPAERVSILVAAWNAEASLERCLHAILQLNDPNLEAIVCAGGTDRTWQIASTQEDPRLRLLAQQPGDGKQTSLAKCFQKATGEIFYLLDADCLITQDAFDRLLAPILRGEEQAVTCAPCEPWPEQTRIPFVLNQCASRVYTSLHQPTYCASLLGSNSAIRRQALEKAGGFQAGIGSGGDYELGKRLLAKGIRIRYHARAGFPVLFHEHVPAYLRQQARWLRNVAVHGARFHAQAEVISSLFTSLLGFAMLTLPFAAGIIWVAVSPLFAAFMIAFWAMAFFHALFSRLRYLKTAVLWLGIRPPRRIVALMPLFLLIDFLAWSVPLAEYPSKRRRERW